MGHLNSILYIDTLTYCTNLYNKRVSVAVGAFRISFLNSFTMYDKSINQSNAKLFQKTKKTYLVVHQRPDNVVWSTGTVHSLPV